MFTVRVCESHGLTLRMGMKILNKVRMMTIFFDLMLSDRCFVFCARLLAGITLSYLLLLLIFSYNLFCMLEP